MEKYYLNEEDYEKGIPSITAFVSDDKPFPSVVDRYYTRYYYKKESSSGENEDHLVLCHSNRVCLVMPAKSHVAFKKGIVSVNYNIGQFDRSQNQVKGKHKKGAMHLQPLTSLAIIKTTDGSEYKIVSCVYGKLLEVNERIKNDFKKMEIEGIGYVAIILPKAENFNKLKSCLIDEANYNPNS